MCVLRLSRWSLIFLSLSLSRSLALSLSRARVLSLLRSQEYKFLALLSIINQHLAIKVLSGEPRQSQHQPLGITGAASEEVGALNKKSVLWGEFTQPEVLEALNDGDTDMGEGQDGDEAKGNRHKKAKYTSRPEDRPKDGRIPLPPARGRDLAMKVEQLKEIRKRVAVGATSLPSCHMYTFFNAKDRVHCMSMSDDATLVAAGFSDSFIKIWYTSHNLSARYGTFLLFALMFSSKGFRGALSPPPPSRHNK